MVIELTNAEAAVCKALYSAINNRCGVCDPTNFSEEDERALLSLQEKGYISNDVNCIILKKEFKEFLDKEFEEV